MSIHELRDPFKLARFCWPHVRFYSKQREIVQSVWDNDRTIVPAGHMLGKDFITGFICLAFFLTRHPCRVVTTSVDHAQLRGVLWGEIRRFLQTSRVPLDSDRGGPLVVNHLHIRKVYAGEIDGLSYMIARVAETGEGLSGHHIAQTGDGVPRTLAAMDEASGLDKSVPDKMAEWANRMLMIGNPYECNNYFKQAVNGLRGTKDRGGDIPRVGRPGLHRKVIRIEATDSPNVQYAMEQIKRGIAPTNEILVPGVLPYGEYLDRCANWDPIKQHIGLRARFWEGEEVKLFPPAWLDRCETAAEELLSKPRTAEAVGIDTGEGSANTVWTAADRLGIIAQKSKRTLDTSVIPGETIAFGTEYGAPPENWVFDRGGGGKQAADQLRAQGYAVRTAAFGGAVEPDLPGRGAREQNKETQYQYVNKRAQMYGQLHLLAKRGYGIPRELTALREQLEPIPLTYDGYGRLKLLAKDELIELIGHSPDEADSAVLAVHGMLHPAHQNIAGAIEVYV